MHVINLGFDLDRFNEDASIRASFRREFDLEDDVIAIGIIGRLTLIKNHKFFIDVAKSVSLLTNKKLKFFIIGDGEERLNLEEYIQSLNLTFSQNDIQPDSKAFFQFTSWRKDMENVYAGLDIVALTSKNEGTPVTLIEAQASSRPVISTNVGGVRDILLPDISGYISPSNDIDLYSQNLLKLIQNDQERIIMGAEGCKFVNSHFSYKRLVSDVKNLYESL